jgi:Family of unknown function (DUF6596)
LTGPADQARRCAAKPKTWRSCSAAGPSRPNESTASRSSRRGNPPQPRPALCTEALRLGRVLAELMPAEPKVHGLVALLEIQTSRIPARLSPAGPPVPLPEQNRSR